MRIVLTLSAILAAVLAITLQEDWLYYVAGVLLLAAIAHVLYALWQDYNSTNQSESMATPRDADPEKELNALGIMDIREKKTGEQRRPDPPRQDAGARQSGEDEPDAQTPSDSKQDKPPSETVTSQTAREAIMKNPDASGDDASGKEKSSAEEPSRKESAAEKQKPSSSASPEQKPKPAGSSSSGSDRREERAADSGSAPSTREKENKTSAQTPVSENGTQEPDEELAAVLKPYLESLREAVGGRTACLLIQEEMLFSYRAEGISSASARVIANGETFSTNEPLLTAGLSRRAASIRPIGDELQLEDLGYYEGEAPETTEVVLAPVSRPDHPATFFLLVDSEDGFDHNRAERLVARFADLLAFVLKAFDEERAPTETAQSEAQSAGTGDEPHRPRREIIAEEMEAFREADAEMALAIVYLNRAEQISSRGPEAVDEAEEKLAARLRQITPDSRVVHFGELTYGLFFEGSVSEAESWATTLQTKMETADSPLEGGVSIGLAMLRPRHQSPDALRGDATEALKEAYMTGTCTILE